MIEASLYPASLALFFLRMFLVKGWEFGFVSSCSSLFGGICGFQDAANRRTHPTITTKGWASVGLFKVPLMCRYVGLIPNLLRCHWKSSRAFDGA